MGLAANLVVHNGVVFADDGSTAAFYQYQEGAYLPRNVLMPFGCWDLVR